MTNEQYIADTGVKLLMALANEEDLVPAAMLLTSPGHDDRTIFMLLWFVGLGCTSDRESGGWTFEVEDPSGRRVDPDAGDPVNVLHARWLTCLLNHDHETAIALWGATAPQLSPREASRLIVHILATLRSLIRARLTSGAQD